MLRLSHSIVLISLLISLLAPSSVSASPTAQTITPDSPEVQAILASLTPQEKVGQLFLVTFSGRDTSETSAIYELIAQYHVGGVALLASNDNFTDVDTFAEDTLALTSALQLLASQGTVMGDGTPTPGAPSQFIPLFIAIPSSEDGISGQALLRGPSGLTQLPNPMTIGATWNPANAETVGRITGAELSALGINMLFGPTLDVIDSPQPDSPADLGARAFGGDPYWVGRMGRAFIQGVHDGSQNRIAVVAQHFPGYGASDRALDEGQIPTVSKTLDELQAIDLAPFYTVARPGEAGVTDALLVSHIRYRGLQGNIRDTTRPISLDPSQLTELLALPELAPWRTQGGVTVSDALGVWALRRFYDATEKTFQAFNIARDAFLAGNDVLYLGQFATPGQDQTEIMKSVLNQFLAKYNEDPAFAQRVDQAVARIIALKLRLYGTFTQRAVAPSFRLDVLGEGTEDVLTITRDAATLISPNSAAELANRLPNRPNISHRIVFITDTRMAQQCSACASRPSLAVDALQQAVLRFYGPQGTGETFSARLTSYSFNDLITYLESAPDTNATETPTPTPEGGGEPPALEETGLAVALENADWVVISMLDVRSNLPSSQAFKRLLAERPDLLQNKRVIVFAFGAPYYLDATEIAQLTAYYGLYNRTASAVEVAARILFQEITPIGASPVSIDAVGYRLIEATAPNAAQVISLSYELPSNVAATPTFDPTLTATVSPTPAAAPVGLNDLITLRTSVIVDRNGHPVPDGTPVVFWKNYLDEGLKGPFATTTTIDGVASAELRLDREGQIEVSVTAEPATLEQFKLRFDVQANVDTVPEVLTSTPGPTDTAAPTTEPTITPTLDFTPTPTPTPPAPQPPVTAVDLFMTVVTLGIMGAVAWRVTNSRVEAVSDGIKLFLLIAIGAFVAYNYYALKGPGYEALKTLGFWAVPLMVWIGGAIGFGVGWWLLRRQRRN